MAGSFNLGTLVTTLGVNTRPLMTAEKQIAGFAGRTNMLMASVRRTLMTVFATVGVGKLAKGFLDAAVSVENYKVSLNAIIKDAKKTDAVFKDLFDWAAVNPIDTEDVIKSFVRLKTAGIENTRAAVAAAADAAVVMQKPVEYVANAMVSTNNKMLRQIGIQLDRTGKMAIIRSGEVRIEVTKDLDSIRQGIIEVLQKNFAGAMESYQHTWRGGLNTMKGLWWSFMTEVMGTASSGGPYTALVEGINRVKDVWIAWRNTADYGEFVTKTQAIFSSFVNGMIGSIEVVVAGFKLLIDHLALTKIAIMALISKKVMGALIASFTFFRAEIALGSVATTFFMRFIYRLRLAFMELRTATTITGGLKGAILALGLSPGGLTFLAITGLILLAESLSGMFGDAATGIRTFNKELRNMPTEKLEAVVAASHSMGGFGMGGAKESIELADRAMKNKMIREGAWRNKMKDDYEGVHPSAPVVPEVDSVADTGKASGASKYQKLLQRMKDEAKYLGANVKEFLPILDAWGSKLKPLSEDWKLIKDYSMEIRTGMAKDVAQDAAASMKRIEEQLQLQEEAKDAATQGVAKFWSEASYGFQQGLIQGEDYFNMLQTEFNNLKQVMNTEAGGFLNMEDMFNWTDEMKQHFSEIQTIGQQLAGIDLTNLNTQLEKSVITKKEWITQVEILIEKYKELPLVVTLLSDALKDVANSEKTNMEEMTKAVEGWANGFAGQLNDMLWKSGTTFEDIAVSFSKMITEMIIQLLIIKPLMAMFGFANGGVVSGGVVPAVVANANGGVFQDGNLTTYARGGVVSRPTLFPMAKGMGLMGEAGAEAIMPLKRNSQGKLGVVASGSDNQGNSEGSGSTHITMNINAVDSRSFVEMMRTNKAGIESIVVENIMKNGAVRSAIRGMA